MKKRLFGSFLTLMTLVSSIALAEGKDTLIIAQAAEAKTMDPVASNDVPSHRFFLIFMTLLFKEIKMEN